MEQFKGTKGKWEVSFKDRFAIGIRCNERALLMVKVEENRAEAEANALLISKAPELLEHLIRLVDRMEENDLGNFHSVKRAKQLIKEATEL